MQDGELSPGLVKLMGDLALKGGHLSSMCSSLADSKKDGSPYTDLIPKINTDIKDLLSILIDYADEGFRGSKG